ncbi:MAG: ATP-binding cassette domain-containing protein [Eubacterium sp.]|nr:ATP-binding cassette domain-containing protein [Eubacterium sp.]
MGLDIRIKNLQFHHVPGSRVDAEIRAGEVVGITGANGAGKTEMLRLIAGILRPKSMGEIMIDGLDPFHGRDLEKLHRRIGFLQQSPKDTMVFSKMIQDAPFGPENQAVDPDVIRKRWEGLKGRLLTGIPENRDFDTLSGGQQQRAALVSVLMLRSQILLLDEPTSMLGRKEGQEVLQLVLKLAKRSEQTVLLVSHDPEVLKRADRVLLLEGGTLRRVRKAEIAAITAAMGASAKAPAKASGRKGAGSEEEKTAGTTGATREGEKPDGSAPGQMAGLVNPLDQFAYESKTDPVNDSVAVTSRSGEGAVRWIMKKRPVSMSPMITLRDVTVRYGRNTVAEHFHAEVCPGGYYEMTGGTGSGKSTLCKLMNGTLFASAGEVVVNGMRLPMAGEKRKTFFGKKDPGLGAVRRFAGYAMQSPEDQLFETSVIFDVMCGPLHAGRRAMEARQDAEEALREMEIPETLWERRPERLSAGEKRRVAIAGILAMHPRVLILDEPYAGLDAEGCWIIRKTIRNYVNQNRAVVVTTHG